MIQANELRIGNWVLAKPLFGNDKTFKILKVSPNEIYRCYHNSKDFAPIHITDEILEKCGMESVSGAIDENYKVRLIDLCFIFRKLNHAVELIYQPFDIEVTEETPSVSFFCPTIKHLHQLQNLYFSLTGEELTFKP